MAARKKYRQAGFTLIEMIMVIVIMGTLSVVAMSKFNKASFDVVTASGELVQAIRYAQQKSMSNTGTIKYRVIVSATGFVVEKENGNSIPHPETGLSAYTKTWTDINLSPASTITFNGYGDPGLAAPLTITLSKDAQSDTVKVEHVTGFTR